MDLIDSAIAEAVSVSEVKTATVEAPQPETQEIKPQQETEAEADEQEARVDEPFPKKAVNALSRRDKRIGKLEAEREALRAELERYKTQPQKAQQKPDLDTGPKEESYSTYADFLEARNEWIIEQKLAAREGQQKETQATEREQRWIAEREQAVATQAQAFIKENPEAADLLEEYGDVIDEFSPQLQTLFLEAENAPLAFFNLAKEGKLEALASMSLAKAAMEIGRAQTQAPPKPRTKAPTPLPAARGSVASGKPLDQLTPREAQAFLNPKD